MSIKDRISVTKDRKGITVQIRPAKDWFLLIVGSLWLCFWTIGGFAAINALAKGTNDRLLYSFWLCGWIIGEVYMSFGLLWTIFGEEIVNIRDGSFEHTRRILGIERRRDFPLKRLSGLRDQGPFPKLNSFRSSFRRNVYSPTVAVHIGRGKSYRFGLNLDKNSAKYLVAELKPYFDEVDKLTIPAVQTQRDW